MKKFITLLVLVGLSVSCSSSSDDSSGNSRNIYGVWEFRKQGVMVGDTPVLEDRPLETPCTEYDKMVYSENGIWTQFDYDNYPSGTCTLFNDDGTFTFQDNIITHIEENQNPEYGNGKYYILELTSTIMSYKYIFYGENGAEWRVKYFVKAD